MASTFNIKGTSYGSFQIGKEGVTLYQGITPPPGGSYLIGDRYLQRGDGSSSPATWFYNGTNWIEDTSVSVPLNMNSNTNISSNGFKLSSDNLSLNNPVTDKPGTTSNSVPTTYWIDQYYSSKASIWNTGNPIGTIISFSGAVIPDTYLLCDGSTFDSSTYPDLFSFLGSNKLPDLRGMFLRGLDTTGNVDSTQNRSLLSFEEGSYTVKDPNNGIASFYANADNTIASLQSTNLDPRANPQDSRMYSYGQLLGNVTSGNQTAWSTMIGVTRPKNIAVNYVIKAKVTSNGTDGDFIPVNTTKTLNVTTNGNLTFDSIKISNNISDTPGNTSNTVPTTSWVDQNYISKSSGGTQLVGNPIAWPTMTPPSGYLALDGSSFNTSLYPQLASVYTSGKLPDLRGMFIRGIDPTGNVDNVSGGRQILSFEDGTYVAYDQSTNFSVVNNLNNGQGGITASNAPQLLMHVQADVPANSASVNCVAGTPATGFQEPANATGSNSILGIARPKNVAFYYIVKAG